MPASDKSRPVYRWRNVHCRLATKECAPSAWRAQTNYQEDPAMISGPIGNIFMSFSWLCIWSGKVKVKVIVSSFAGVVWYIRMTWSNYTREEAEPIHTIRTVMYRYLSGRKDRFGGKSGYNMDKKRCFSLWSFSGAMASWEKSCQILLNLPQ